MPHGHGNGFHVPQPARLLGTVMVIGSASSRYAPEERAYFAMAMLGSCTGPGASSSPWDTVPGASLYLDAREP